MDHDITPRILVIDDQKSIHEDYRKIFDLGQFRPAELCQAAADLFGPEGLYQVPGGSARQIYSIDFAFQGEEGLRYVQTSLEEGRPYSLAFVDIRMPPGWDGIETISRIWEIDPDMLVVVCSAYSDYSWEEMVRRLGRTDRFLILKKPLESIEVRQLAMALSEKWRLARTDSMTGLINRRSCNEHLEREWKRASRQGHQLWCVFLDIDYFKRINDNHGHDAGDAVLKAVANLARETSRAGDFVCRYGGEELCVLLPGVSEEGGATVWAEPLSHDAGGKTVRSIRGGNPGLGQFWRGATVRRNEGPARIDQARGPSNVGGQAIGPKSHRSVFVHCPSDRSRLGRNPGVD